MKFIKKNYAYFITPIIVMIVLFLFFRLINNGISLETLLKETIHHITIISIFTLIISAIYFFIKDKYRKKLISVVLICVALLLLAYPIGFALGSFWESEVYAKIWKYYSFIFSLILTIFSLFLKTTIWYKKM